VQPRFGLLVANICHETCSAKWRVVSKIWSSERESSNQEWFQISLRQGRSRPRAPGRIVEEL
jgi:hypothetical protein